MRFKDYYPKVKKSTFKIFYDINAIIKLISTVSWLNASEAGRLASLDKLDKSYAELTFMEHAKIITLEIIIVLFFIWRFIRTRRLYLTSIQEQTSEQGISPLKHPSFHNFVKMGLLGQRKIKPISFYIRGIVFLVVAVCLLPFKSYSPIFYWLVVTLIAFYVPWCIIHGIMLKKRCLHNL